MRKIILYALPALVVLMAAGCMQIITLDQPYDATAGKDFVTTITLRTPEAEEPAEGEEPTETFSYGVLAFAVPDDWDITGIKTTGGEISPTWSPITAPTVDSGIVYEGDVAYIWKMFKTDESFSSIEQASKTFTVEVSIRPPAPGKYELGYASGVIDKDSFSPDGGYGDSGEETGSVSSEDSSFPSITPYWGTNEVNGGTVIFKRIWVQ